MPQSKPKVICEPCRQEMNYHAEKLVDPTTAEEAARVDPAFGALVEEMHTCPDCGHSATRHGS